MILVKMTIYIWMIIGPSDNYYHKKIENPHLYFENMKDCQDYGKIISNRKYFSIHGHDRYVIVCEEEETIEEKK